MGGGNYLKLIYALIMVLMVSLSLGFNHSQGVGVVLAGHDAADANLTVMMRCIDREREALLAFKHGLVDSRDTGVFSFWGGREAEQQDCCSWKGVECDSQTRHVIKLDLGEYEFDDEGKIFSPRLIELQYLRHFYLGGRVSYNCSQMLEVIASLTNLRFLHLPSCEFGGQIQNAYQLGKLTQLQHLYLIVDGFTGQIPYQLENLTNLEHLKLCCFSSAQNLNWLPRLSSLTYLDLTFNNLSNALNWAETVNKLPQLRDLTLKNCGLGSPLFLSTLSSINSSKSLASVDLSQNYLTAANSIFLWLSNYNTSLVHLDLSLNRLTGSIPDVFGNMSSLSYLDLSSNELEGADSHSFARSCSLQTLSVSNNSMSVEVSKFVQVLSSCAQNSLESLDLSWNNLTGSLPESIRQMSCLKILDLSANRLSGSIPKSIGQISQLETLDLSENQLRGTIPESIVQISRLETLDLSQNQLSGSIPESIGKMSSLGSLRLFDNQLNGTVPESIGKMSNLHGLYLGKNSLKGVISETHFSNLSKLLFLDMSSNSLVFNVNSDWVPSFQLFVMVLESCKLGRNFPNWLRTQKSLIMLDISNAGIFDILPSWFWDLCRQLTFLNLSHNQIRGTFANVTLEFVLPGLELRLSSNQFEGPFPYSLLSQAAYLDLSNNKISGSLSSLCSCAPASVSFLNLSSNSISGKLPNCLAHLEKLVMLDLSGNAFFGKIPTTIGSLLGIKTLKLRRNRFVGELPSSLKNCTSLEVMDIGDNQLSGPIPKWLGVSLRNLIILILSSNHFHGNMPSELCNLSDIQILDVSANNISGSIPKCLGNLTTLSQKGSSILNITHRYHEGRTGMTTDYLSDYVDDATFTWKGTLRVYKTTLGLVKSIDFSSNILTGEIPSEITRLIGLVSLNLSRNYLTGEITPDIGELDSLDSLDLSRNRIEGRIPASLGRIDRLGVLDLSYNNLYGKIPTGTQLQSFDPSVYAGNPQLCGPPLQKACDPGEPPVVSHEEDKDELISHGFYISMAVGFAVGFWGVCGSLIFIKSWRYAYVKFLNVLEDWTYVRIALMRRRWMPKR